MTCADCKNFQICKVRNELDQLIRKGQAAGAQNTQKARLKNDIRRRTERNIHKQTL